MLDEAENHAILSALPAKRKAEDSVALLIGPEGGWTDRERILIIGAHWAPISLGGQILRAETAAVAALAILNAAWLHHSEF